jgi:hypothetical protein
MKLYVHEFGFRIGSLCFVLYLPQGAGHSLLPVPLRDLFLQEIWWHGRTPLLPGKTTENMIVHTFLHKNTTQNVKLLSVLEIDNS